MKTVKIAAAEDEGERKKYKMKNINLLRKIKTTAFEEESLPSKIDKKEEKRES